MDLRLDTRASAIEAARLERCVQRCIDFIKTDTSRRVPRAEADRANAFERWLDRYQRRLDPVIEAEARQEFPDLFGQEERTVEATALLHDRIWPGVADFLREYAVRGQAAAWVGRHMGDATTIGWPERIGDRWRVALGVMGYGEDLGQVILDSDGNILPDETTTREQVLEVIGGRTRSPAATTPWK